MSLAEWKKKFYPIPANMVSKKDALAHSLKKWEGLLSRNLKKFNLEIVDSTLYSDIGEDEEDELRIDSDSCALCNWYMDIPGKRYCENCPLYKIRKGIACDDKSETEKFSPYGTFYRNNDARPMYNLLKKASEKKRVKI
jgi:hypothetical protein